ncbi:hypothetical protein [Arthrobacter sp. Y81]|uniref:hypothetical protein n=1 Tax=Arthrobacter sp. Y81 TaxID=2058897 RepID=UPI0015E33C66|nr:hypothetical protein [Arthrobacter sp. Y81]
MNENNLSPEARMKRRIASTPRPTVDAQGRRITSYTYTYDDLGNFIKAEPIEDTNA